MGNSLRSTIMVRVRHSRRTALLIGMLLASSALSGGCASMSNPTTAESIPVHRLPPEVFGRPREEEKTIPLTLLRQKQSDTYLLDVNDILGVYIEGVLGDKSQIPPLLNLATVNDQSLPPAIGFPIPVQDDGTLTLPLIDPIYVKGKSILQVQEMIREAYTKGGILVKGKDRSIVTLAKKRTYSVTVVRQDAGGV